MALDLNVCCKEKSPFITKDASFYKMLARLMVVVVFQNLVAYSVNMADNLMLGAYSQSALSGAATVNMIQFMVQQITMAIGDSVVVLGSQYWGKRETAPIRKFSGFALIIGLSFGLVVFLLTTFVPTGILKLFTNDAAYIAQGLEYLKLIRFTYPIYVLTMILMASLRSVETVNISLKISISSLIIDVCINYVLIFGKFGFPELGIYGAAIGTLVARIVELCIVLYYVLLKDKKLKLFSANPFKVGRETIIPYMKIFTPSFISNFVWSIATPLQTGILGHLSSDAIAANSVSTTIYQYLKVLTVGEASASSVVIGKTIGEGKSTEKIKEYSRTLQVLFLAIGFVLSVGLFFIRIPFLAMYDLTPEAFEMAHGIMILLCFVMMGMSYQMPASVGIIKGGGDVNFMLYVNVISTWGIVMPLSFLAAFVWELPVVWVVALLNSDQIFKCIPVAIRTNRYKWIKRLT